MNDDRTLDLLVRDKGIDAERLAAFRQALVEADEADVILLSGISRDDWLAQIDRASAGDRDRLPS